MDAGAGFGGHGRFEIPQPGPYSPAGGLPGRCLVGARFAVIYPYRLAASFVSSVSALLIFRQPHIKTIYLDSTILKAGKG
jgi:hypothetical protein